MVKLRKLSHQEITGLAGADYRQSLQDDQKSQMAIPSYLHPNPLVRWLMWRRYEVIASWIDLEPATRVLDFGCGVGIFLSTLASKGSTVYAFDIEPQYAQKLCREKCLPVKFIEELDEIEDSSLDAIIAADVLEHIEDVSITLALLRKKLNTGGRMFVSGPTENLAYKTLRIAVGFDGKGDYHFSNINLLIPLICSSGFSDLRRVTLPYVFGPALFRLVEFEKTNREGNL